MDKKEKKEPCMSEIMAQARRDELISLGYTHPLPMKGSKCPSISDFVKYRDAKKIPQDVKDHVEGCAFCLSGVMTIVLLGEECQDQATKEEVEAYSRKILRKY